jgi:hypothetical protein
VKTAQFILLFLTLFVTQTISHAQNVERHTIFEDRFDEYFHAEHWRVEAVEGTSVKVQGGKLVIDSPGGVTVWLNKMLIGNYTIQYDWKVMVAGGKNDRLSDLNQFWMATDPKSDSLFTRQGKFEEYDSLNLYYVGMGGNRNTTTRFRKYDGNGDKKLIGEYTDKEHLLTPNHTYEIKIVVLNGKTSFWVDGKMYFSHLDTKPLTQGYFGFRSTWSRHQIDNFRITETLR